MLVFHPSSNPSPGFGFQERIQGAFEHHFVQVPTDFAFLISTILPAMRASRSVLGSSLIFWLC